MSISDKQSEKILNLIYGAAAEEGLWASVLTEIADLTRSAGGVLYGQSASARRVYFDYSGRLDPDCSRVYQERHMTNLWMQYMETQPVGQIVFSDDVAPLAALRATAFFDEVLRPQNLAHNSMVALAAKDDFRAAFNICRTPRQGPFGMEEARLFQWLMPHLRRSITLAFKLDGYKALRQAAFHVLDQLTDTVLLLDRRAQLLFANAAARALEASGALLLRKSVTSHAQPHSQKLSQLIRSAANGSVGGCMSMPGHIAGQQLTIFVSSVQGEDVGRFSDLNLKDAAVLVFIIDPANRSSIPLARLVDAFGLTPAEARVAVASSAGKTTLETAHLLGLSPNTVKTHMRRVFAKTGTGRQAELARLVASMATMRFMDEAR